MTKSTKMVASKPTILFLHGAYHPPACYRSLITKIEAAGLEVITPRLASLGKDASGTLEDDLSVVHAAAGLLIESGKDVVIVAHSYGGFVAMNAASYLISTGQGKKGNLKSIVYISGLLAEKHSIALAACNPKLVDENGPDLVEVFDIQMNGGLVCLLFRLQFTYGVVALQRH